MPIPAPIVTPELDETLSGLELGVGPGWWVFFVSQEYRSMAVAVGDGHNTIFGCPT